MEHNFFTYQRRRLRTLLGWGIGSTLTGLPLLLSRRPFWRNTGLQAIGWGMIDAILALIGSANARRNAVRMEMGELDLHDAEEEARKFQRILWINAGLDLLYIGGGLELARRSSGQPARRGTGVGIAVQGLFLLLFDSLLAREVDRRWLHHAP